MAIHSLKALYLMKILVEKTNSDYPMTSTKIIKELRQYNITAERKSIYDAIEDLKQFGIDIKYSKVNPKGYYTASRDFDMPELKLLIDAVQASKFITEKKSIDLINKIKMLTDKHSATALQREVYISNRVKSGNERIYYNIDTIHRAIFEQRKISFQYCEYSLNKRLVARKNGKEYVYTPYTMIWEDEYYYLVVYDEAHDSFVHFRTDKMKNISILDDKAVYPGKPLDIGLYAKRLFSMFAGDIMSITLEANHSLIGVFIDTFGKDIIVHKKEKTFCTDINVAFSYSFLSWVFQFGESVKILGPTEAIKAMKKYVNKINTMYNF